MAPHLPEGTHGLQILQSGEATLRKDARSRLRKGKRNRCAEISDCKNGLPARPPLYQNVRQPDHAIAPGV